MKVTVVNTTGIGQIFAPVPREYSSLGFPLKALFDALTSNASLLLWGGNAGLTEGVDLSIAQRVMIANDAADIWDVNGAPQLLTSVLSSTTSRTTYDYTSNHATPKVVTNLSLQALIDALCRDDPNSPTLAFRTDMDAAFAPAASIAGIHVSQATGNITLLGPSDFTNIIAALTAPGITLVEFTAVAAQKWE